ncbi:hypothetical protein WMZ97_08735 [Lentibacillus sp. N15]|uniref:hypothetical protein n=1 Tax=Lentibacillus songyuanensis TaxID=3136161 RepID=UPI0031BB19AD
MKRYWKLIVLVVVIVLTVGTFYIKQDSSIYPKMVLQTKSGNEALVDHIRLEAYYYATASWDDMVDITTKGAVYTGKQSFFKRLEDENDPKIAHLKQDYRSFLRGKIRNAEMFAENKNVVVYANVEPESYRYESTDFKLHTAILNKQDKQQSSFSIPVNQDGKYSDIYVERVYLVDDQVKVLTQNMLAAGDTSDDTDMRVYSLDIQSGKMVDDETVVSGSDNSDAYEWLRVLSRENASNDETKDILIVKENNKVSPEDGEITYTESNVFYYDLQTDEHAEVALPKQLQQGTEVQSVHGTTLYFSKMKKNQLDIIAYDMKTKKITEKQTIKLPTSYQAEEMGSPLMKVKDDHAYIVSSEQMAQQDTSVMVVDLQSGKTVYEGTIAIKDNHDITDYELYINDFLFEEETGDND